MSEHDKNFTFTINTREKEDFARPRPYGMMPTFRSKDYVEPYAKDVEFKRALNAVKVKRMYAMPFVSSFSGHKTGVSALAVYNYRRSSYVVSADHEGTIFIHNPQNNKKVSCLSGNSASVVKLVTASLSLLSLNKNGALLYFNLETPLSPLKTFGFGSGLKRQLKSTFNSVAFLKEDSFVATADFELLRVSLEKEAVVSSLQLNSPEVLDLCETNKNGPLQNLVLTTTKRGTLHLFDVRQKAVISDNFFGKISSAKFNPWSPKDFCVAANDGNLYGFDMRKFEVPCRTFNGHLGPVTSLCYANKGKEIASGSLDQTIRIFNSHSAFCREIYHTKRMDKVYSLEAFESKDHFLVSGSEDGNVRIWKTDRSAKLSERSGKEKIKNEYKEKLIEKYGNYDEIRKIKDYRHVPKFIANNQKRKKKDSLRDLISK